MNVSPIFNNNHTVVIDGLFDLSAAAAVVAISNPDGTTKTCRGDNISVVKRAATTGIYDVTVKGVGMVKLVELQRAVANLCIGAPAGAFGVQVTSVTQTADTEDIVIVLTTVNNASPPVAAETTAAIKVSFSIGFACHRMGGVI